MKKGWKKWHNFNLLLSIFLSYLLVLIICYVSSVYYLRVDINSQSNFKLSPRSITLLESLNKPISIIILISEEDKLYQYIQNLIDEYHYFKSNINITWVDPINNPSKTEELSYRYKLESHPVIILDDGNQHRVIKESKIVDIDHNTNRIKVFRGEQVISSALLELRDNIRPIVYFLQGHGECNLKDFSENGYSSLVSLLNYNAIEARSFEFNGPNAIPDDAEAIIIAGPKRKLSKSSIEMIEDYLNRSGRLFIMLDALYETGLENFLREWGVVINSGFVLDPEQSLRGQDVNVNNFGVHPINDGMNKVVQLILPCAVIPATVSSDNDADKPNLSVLLRSSKGSWLESSLNEQVLMLNEEDGDIRGPIQLGIAVERGSIQELDSH